MRREASGEFFMEKMPFPRLTEDQCRHIHEASLEILDRVGAQLDLPEAVAGGASALQEKPNIACYINEI